MRTTKIKSKYITNAGVYASNQNADKYCIANARFYVDLVVNCTCNKRTPFIFKYDRSKFLNKMIEHMIANVHAAHTFFYILAYLFSVHWPTKR